MIGRARCVFPTEWCAGAESGVVAAAQGPPCVSAPNGSGPLRRGLSPRSLLNAFVALLTPGECRLCSRPLLQAMDFPVCPTCLDGLQASALGLVCVLCGEPLAPDSTYGSGLFSHDAEVRCPACVASRPNFVQATAFGLYDDLRPAIRLMKFEGVPSLAKPLGAMMASAMLNLRSESPGSLAVIPVPLFRGKRAFNQSTLLAESALHLLRSAEPGWKLSLRSDLLRRTRRTESQFLLSPAQRRENLHGAFKAKPEVRGVDILLVDDVYTTGATAVECTRVLLRAGANSVRVATLARAGRDTAARWKPSVPLARRTVEEGFTQRKPPNLSEELV